MGFFYSHILSSGHDCGIRKAFRTAIKDGDEFGNLTTIKHIVRISLFTLYSGDWEETTTASHCGVKRATLDYGACTCGTWRSVD